MQTKYSYKKAFKWLLVYLLLALVPMLIAIAGIMPESRGFIMELGVAFGFIGLGMLGAQFLFSGRFKSVAPDYGMDNILQLHREMGIIAFLFVFFHPTLILLADSSFWSYFDPRVNLPRSVALISVSIALVVLLASSLWRLTFGLSYERWRLLHGVLSVGVLFIGVVHSVQVSHYLAAVWQQVLLVVVFAGLGYLVVHTRLVRPWRSKAKPWKIVRVTPERDDCWTLHLEPCGHNGMTFECGQFVWITIGATPFSLQQHPFSIASASDDDGLLITAKATGDFTSSWENIGPGTRAYLEGPFGSFTPVEGKNLFLVMGGIGITPAMSMLRTMAQREDKRRAILIYANPDWEAVTFREELDELAGKIDLKLVHVLQETHADWKGETGLIDKELLKRHLPENPGDYCYYLCGPEPMMDVAELGLRGLGVDWRSVYSERFEVI